MIMKLLKIKEKSHRIWTVWKLLFATICNHCQRYEPTALKCAPIETGEDPCCTECTVNHDTGIVSTEKKCINFKSNGKWYKVVEEELDKIKARTESRHRLEYFKRVSLYHCATKHLFYGI